MYKMKLEKEISQTEWKNEYQKLIINLIYTHNYLLSKMSPVFKKFGITRQQFNVLRILRGQYPGPATINLISKRMLDKMSDASRIVDRLLKKQLIDKTKNSNDRRAADIIISKKGLDLLKRLDPEVDKFNDLVASLASSEAKNVNDYLDKIRG